VAQADPDADSSGLQERYGAAAFEGGKDVNVRNFDGQSKLTEADALIAYIQVLGTMVDFSTFIPDPTR
jgi:cytochrome c oxidase cbb3-type subunit 2